MWPLLQKCSFVHTYTRAHAHKLKGFTESLLWVGTLSLTCQVQLDQGWHSWEAERDGVIPNCWPCLDFSPVSSDPVHLK